MYPAPSPTYIGPPHRQSGAGNKPIRRLVIHCTVSPGTAGWARKIAYYFKSASAGGSAHYVIDEAEVIQAAYDSVVCWHAPPNPHSLGLEMCAYPSTVTPAYWSTRTGRRTLRRTAKLVAHLCLTYRVPVRFLDVGDVKANFPGITTHNNVSLAYGQSSHWDPGKWPRDRFMRMVRKEHARLKRIGA